MHPYKVRPGYGSKDLLIEFGPSFSDEHFVADLKQVLSHHGLRKRGTGHYVLGETVFFESPAGPFELDDDGYCVFVHADKNQNAIHYLDQILQHSGLFEKQQVDYKDYVQPAPAPNDGPATPNTNSGSPDGPPSVS